MTALDTVTTIAEPWRSWLGEGCVDFDPDLPIVFYEDDGTEEDDEVDLFPPLAIRDDAQKTIAGASSALVWPVDVPGWADIRTLGWRGILPLLEAGVRTREEG